MRLVPGTYARFVFTAVRRCDPGETQGARPVRAVPPSRVFSVLAAGTTAFAGGLLLLAYAIGALLVPTARVLEEHPDVTRGSGPKLGDVLSDLVTLSVFAATAIAACVVLVFGSALAELALVALFAGPIEVFALAVEAARFPRLRAVFAP